MKSIRSLVRRKSPLLGFILGAAATWWIWPGMDSVKWGALKVVEQGHHTWEPVDETALVNERWHQLSRRRDIEFAPTEVRWTHESEAIRAGELPVFIKGDPVPVDTLFLTIINPELADFSVHTSPGSYRDIDEWVDALGADVVINGSYYNRLGHPDTPLISFGSQFGPREYAAEHGAFVVDSKAARLVDLKDSSWSKALEGSQHAFVSYPLLLDAHGSTRSEGRTKWLANRSFIGITHTGEIVLATTERAFFTLENLSKFLRKAPLDLAMALNLDGGPVASLAARLPGYRHTVYGTYETQDRNGQEYVLTPGIAGKKYALPIVLAVKGRRQR